LAQHRQSWQVYVDRKRRYRRKKSKNKNPAASAGSWGAGFHSKSNYHLGFNVDSSRKRHPVCCQQKRLGLSEKIGGPTWSKTRIRGVGRNKYLTVGSYFSSCKCDGQSRSHSSSDIGLYARQFCPDSQYRPDRKLEWLAEG
jgi:hypothetical protein